MSVRVMLFIGIEVRRLIVDGKDFLRDGVSRCHKSWARLVRRSFWNRIEFEWSGVWRVKSVSLSPVSLIALKSTPVMYCLVKDVYVWNTGSEDVFHERKE